MKTKDIRALTPADRQKELISLRKAAYGLRVQLATQQHSKTSEAKRIRKAIARIKTISAESAGVSANQH